MQLGKVCQFNWFRVAYIGRCGCETGKDGSAFFSWNHPTLSTWNACVFRLPKSLWSDNIMLKKKKKIMVISAEILPSRYHDRNEYQNGPRWNSRVWSRAPQTEVVVRHPSHLPAKQVNPSKVNSCFSRLEWYWSGTNFELKSASKRWDPAVIIWALVSTSRSCCIPPLRYIRHFCKVGLVVSWHLSTVSCFWWSVEIQTNGIFNFYPRLFSCR